MREVDIRNLGLIHWKDSDEMMRDLQQKRIAGDIGDTILICEHPEIVTIGPRARSDGLSPPPDYESAPTDRGGGMTWHGEGQIVVYPVIMWDYEDEKNVKSVISKLEQWVISSLQLCGIKGYRDERMQGVWVDNHKICSIGLSFLRWTSRHGLTINYDTPAGRVEMVAGCGLDAQTTTCLTKLGYSEDYASLCEKLISTCHSELERIPIKTD